MTRLRWTWHWKDKLITSNVVLAGDDTYEASIVYDKYIGYYIMNSKGRVIHKEKCFNPAECKRKAKQYLKNLGAKFYNEVRMKK